MKPILIHTRKSCLILAVLLVWGCHKSDDVQPELDNRGRLVADLPASFYRLLDWSADGQELYYWDYYQYAPPNKGNYPLYALNIKTGNRRLVYDDALMLAGYALADQSPDGQFLYIKALRYTKGPLGGYFLYRINTQQTNQAVVIDSSYDAYSPTNPRIPNQLLSADGAWMVFQHRPDSVRIHNLVTKTTVAYPASQPIAFSPDGSRVLLYRSVGLNPGYWDLSLADLSEKPVDTSIPRGQYPYASSSSAIQWSTEGIRYVYGNSVPGPAGLFMWNVTQQKSTLIRAQPDDEGFVPTVNGSRDGQRIFFRSSLKAFFTDARSFIYISDLTTLKSNKIAMINPTDSERNGIWSSLLLSYDKTQLAYAINGKIYVVPVPV